MNHAQFTESMQRILAFMAPARTPEDDRHLGEYLKALFEQIGNWDGFMFDQVTKIIVKNLTAGRKPAVKDFEAIYSKMRENLPKTEFKCITCNTTGFTYVWMLETTTGSTERFIKPCPDCRKNHHYARAPIRSGWVEMEGNPPVEYPERMQGMVEDLLNVKTESPKDALEKITQLWREGKMDVGKLVAYVGRRVKRNNFNEERRKNRLVRDLIESEPPVQVRETTAQADAGSPGLAVLTKPDEKGFFDDGSDANDEDIPF